VRNSRKDGSRLGEPRNLKCKMQNAKMQNRE
jgi:hypothetical protein